MGKTKSCCRYAAVVVALIVLLRVGVGCHFLYEGLWKMDKSNGFSAKGFLGMAKGPTKELYYMFLPDLGGEERIQMAEVYRVVKNGENSEQERIGWTLPVIETEWYDYYMKFEKKYGLDNPEIDNPEAVDPEILTLRNQRKAARDIFNQYVLSLREYTLENREDFRGFVASKRRFEEALAKSKNDAEYQRIRDWDAQLKYRNEGEKFAAAPVSMGENMQLALWCVLSPEQKAKGELSPIAYGANKSAIMTAVAKIPCLKGLAVPTTMGALDLAVTLGLSAIGLCLMLGLCTRLACLGGALFMINVVLSQFPWPTVYPYPPEVVGHSMVFNKDTIELVVLLVLASLPAGRWGGLDWFLWNCVGQNLYRYFGIEKDPIPEVLQVESCN